MTPQKASLFELERDYALGRVAFGVFADPILGAAEKLDFFRRVRDHRILIRLHLLLFFSFLVLFWRHTDPA